MSVVQSLLRLEFDKLITVVQNSTADNVLSTAISAIEFNTVNWSDEFKILYNKIVKAFVYYTIQDLSSSKAEPKFNISKDMNDYINDFTANKIKLINDTTKQDVKYIILKNLEAGNRMRSIEYDLRQLYDGFNKSRAKTIARTEVAGISNYGSLMGAFEAGAKTKKWIPILDKFTRDSHWEMEDYQEIELDEYFNVGNSKMQYPGDPNGAAEEVINCRCSLNFSR